LTFIVLPFLVSLLIHFINPESQTTYLLDLERKDHSRYEKWLKKVESMPKPLRYIPGFQTAYHICVVLRMGQHTFEVTKTKSLQRLLEEKIEENSIKTIPENFNSEQSAYDKFRKGLGKELGSYLEEMWIGDSKEEHIQQIKSELGKEIIKSQKNMSKLQRTFLRSKIYEAFLESSPQFCLQLYIIISAGYFGGPGQIFTIITSFASVVTVSMNIYLKMPLASGDIPYQHWKDFIFIFPTMLIIIIPRLVGLVIVASMFKPWFFAIVLLELCNFLIHWKSIKKNPEDAILGLYVSWFSSCVIKTKRRNFLVTSTILPVSALLAILSFSWICVAYQIEPISGHLEENHPIFICLPQNNFDLNNLTSIVRCPIYPNFNDNCSDTLLNPENYDSKTTIIYGTFCPYFINESGFIPEMIPIMAIVLSGLAVGLLLTFFLNWYIFSINRYCLSYKFPCIDPIWNPDHDIIKDVVQKLYMTQEEKKKINSIYKQQNEKLVAGSKKTILQIATEFGLMKLIKSSIDTFDGIEIEKLFIEDTVVSFLGIACKTGSVETIKWILSCMNNKKNGKKELESQKEPLVLVDCEIFFKGITQEKEIPPISVATNPALDFLLHEGNDLTCPAGSMEFEFLLILTNFVFIFSGR
jgi:hypothetical protein